MPPQAIVCRCTTLATHYFLIPNLTVSGFDLAWFSSLSSKRLCVFGLNGAIYIVNFFLLTSFSLPFSELSLVGLALGVVD